MTSQPLSAVSVPARTIVVVEDDAVLRQNCCRLLQVLVPEARVLEADSGRAAQQLLAEHEVSVALVDRGLPDADGAQLIAALRKLRPDLFAILMTGGAAEAAFAPEVAGAIDHVLLKPFEVSDLLALLDFAVRAPHQPSTSTKGRVRRRPTPHTSRGLVPAHELFVADRAVALPGETRHQVINRLNRLLLCARALEADAHGNCTGRMAMAIQQHVDMVVQTVTDMAQMLTSPSSPALGGGDNRGQW